MRKGREMKEYIAHQYLEPCLTLDRDSIIICIMNELIVCYSRKYALGL